MLGVGALGWVSNAVPTGPASAILELKMHLLAAGAGGTGQCRHGPRAALRPQRWWGPGWGKVGVPTLHLGVPRPPPPHPRAPRAEEPSGTCFGWRHRSIPLLMEELAVIPLHRAPSCA